MKTLLYLFNLAVNLFTAWLFIEIAKAGFVCASFLVVVPTALSVIALLTRSSDANALSSGANVTLAIVCAGIGLATTNPTFMLSLAGANLAAALATLVANRVGGKPCAS